MASAGYVAASCHLLGCPYRRATPRARRSSPISRWLGVLLLATLAVVLCPSGPVAAGPDVPAAIKRVIFVTIDTLRADHLGVHGYPRDTSPFLDELGRKGLVFSNAYATSSLTAVSHASLFTSLYPDQHGVLENWKELGEETFTMAGMFQSKGFQTAGFPSVRFLTGMRRGFDTFEDEVRILNRNWHETGGRHQEANQTIDRVIVWLHDERTQDRFFLWIHLFDVHQHSKEQYRSPYYKEMLRGLRKQVPESFRQWLVAHQHVPNSHHHDVEAILWDFALYDVQIRLVDDQLSRLFKHLDRMGYGEETLWVTTSDHGEGLGNHSYGAHRRYLYNELVHVPLILYLKDSARLRGRVDPLVRHVDLLPTLADLMGFRIPDSGPAIEGESLLPLVRGERAATQERLAYTQRGHPTKRGQLRALQSLTEKYIVGVDGDEFYDLSRDPYELANSIHEENPAKRALMRQLAEIALESSGRTPPPKGMPVEDVDPLIIEELRAMGYVVD